MYLSYGSPDGKGISNYRADMLQHRKYMKGIARTVLNKAKALIILSTCSICGGQLTSTLYILQVVGSVFISTHLAVFLNQKDCRQ